MGRVENVDYDYYFRLGFESKEQVDLFFEYANRKITGNMNEPDSPASAQSQLREQPGSYFGYLSDADDRSYTEREWKTLRQTPKLGLGSPPAGGGLGAATATPLAGSPASAPLDYTIVPGEPISEIVLNNYLDRAIRVTDLSQMYYPDGGRGPEYARVSTSTNPTYRESEAGGYNPSSEVYDAPIPDLGSCLYNPNNDHGRILQSVVLLGAKFVWDMVFLWGNISCSGPSDPSNNTFPVAGMPASLPWYLVWVCQTLKHDIDYIHYYDPDVICGAGIAEWVGGWGGSRCQVTNFRIPPMKIMPLPRP